MRPYLLTTLLVPTLVLAAAAVQAQPAVPQVQEQNGIQYASGGVGEGEREALETLGPQFNLKLVFAGPEGVYLSNIPVVIRDSRGGVVLDTASNGPWFFASLPAGRYTLVAGPPEEVTRRSLSLRAGSRQELVLRFTRAMPEPEPSQAAPAPASVEPPVLGQHTMTGRVTALDRGTGFLSVDTPEGPLRVHFPPAALQTLRVGDSVALSPLR
jgi:hypothetical protein